MEIVVEESALPSTTANHNAVLSQKTTPSVRAAFKAHHHAESAQAGNIELQYHLAVEENKLLEEKLKPHDDKTNFAPTRAHLANWTALRSTDVDEDEKVQPDAKLDSTVLKRKQLLPI